MPSRAALAYGWKLVTLSWKGIRAQRLRAFLSASGVTVGIAVVILTLAIGDGAREEALRQVRQLGTTSILVRRVALPERERDRAERGSAGLTAGDAMRLNRISPEIEAVPMAEAWGMAATGDREAKARVVGTTPAAAEASRLEMRAGRFLVPEDGRERRRVCVLGDEVSRGLFRLESPLGKRVSLDGEGFQVVGVIESRESPREGQSLVRARDVNRDVYVPLEVAAPAGAVRDDWPVDEIALVAARESTVRETARLVRGVLERVHRGAGDYEVVVPLELLEQRRQTQRTFSTVLAGVAALSLLVGGIGILNVMLATVSERIPEVGVRRAVGATAQDIALQFLAESATLTFFGGVAGTAIGLAGSAAIHALAGWPIRVSAVMVVGVLLVCVVCGLVFGMYPAIQAASADPIEALRYE